MVVTEETTQDWLSRGQRIRRHTYELKKDVSKFWRNSDDSIDRTVHSLEAILDQLDYVIGKILAIQAEESHKETL